MMGEPTGYDLWDTQLAGWIPGDLVILAARPSMGKTALAIELAMRQLKRGNAVGIFSLETGRAGLVLRFACLQSRVSSHRVRVGHLTSEDRSKLLMALAEISDMPLWIDDRPVMRADEFEWRLRNMAQRHKIRFAFLDYIQLLRADGNSRVNQVTEVSMRVKAAARILGEVSNGTLVALSQLSRTKPGERPRLDHLRECVVGETLVALANGTRVPISTLENTAPRVLAVSKQGKIVPALAEKVWSVGSKPIFRIQMASGRQITCARNHLLLTAFGWKRARYLSAGHRIAVAGSLPNPGRPVNWSDDRIILLAHMIGDGSYLTNRPVRYTTGSEENSRAVKRAAKKEFGSMVNRRQGPGNWHQLEISGNGNRWHPSGLNLWFRKLGIWNQRSKQKIIPPEVFKLPNEKLSLFLRHIWATDGTIAVNLRGNKTFWQASFSTSSRELASGLAFLLLRFGITGRIGWADTCYQVNVSGVPNLKKFVERIGAFGPKKEQLRRLSLWLKNASGNTNVDMIYVGCKIKDEIGASGLTRKEIARRMGVHCGRLYLPEWVSRELLFRYATALKSTQLKVIAKGHILFDKIKSIQEAGQQPVYDMTVPGEASWVSGEAVISHNSGQL
jgi:replicative DNA helicase